MGSFIRCINTQVSLKEVSKLTADKLKTKVDNYIKRQNKEVSTEELGRLKFDLLRQNKKDLLAAKQQAILVDKIKENPQQGIRALLDYDYTGKFKYDEAVPADVWSLTKVYEGKNFQTIHEAIEHYRSKIPGGFDLNAKTRIQDIEELVSALFGNKVGRPEIERMAQSFIQVEKGIIKDLQNKGAIIDYNKNRRVISFDSDNLRAQGEQAFVDRMYKNLDLQEVYKGKTEAEIKQSLSDTYKRVITNGASDAAKEGKAVVKTSVRGGRSDAKFVYKSAEAYLDTFYAYSNGDIFEAMIRDIQDLSREQALTRVFGPKYEQTFKILSAIEKTQTALAPESVSKSAKASKFFAENEQIFNTLTGNLQGYEQKTLGNILATVRYLTMAKSLGSAFLTSLTDHAVTKRMAKVAGIHYGTIAKNYARMFTPKFLAPNMQKTARRQAAEIAAVIDGATTGSTGSARMGEDVLTSRASQRARRAADAVFRISLLTPHTTNIKVAVELSYQAEYGLLTHLEFKNLPKANKKWLEGNNFTSEQWEKIRSFSKDGEIDMNRMFKEDQRLFEQWAAIRVAHTRASIPEPSALIQTAMGADLKAGSIGRTFKSSVGGLMSYNLSLTHVQAQLAANNILFATKSSKVGQIMAVTVYSAIMTAFSLQLKAIANGEDFYDVTDPKYWGVAFLRTIPFGDNVDRILRSRDSGDVAKALGGPYIGAAYTMFVKIKAAAYAGFQYVALDSIPEEVWQKAMYDVFDEMASYVPGTSVWQYKLAIDRLIKDQIQKVADPKAYNSFSKEEQRLMERDNREMYWAPGELAPRRLPRALTH
jgi:hypothetical protein